MASYSGMEEVVEVCLSGGTKAIMKLTCDSQDGARTLEQGCVVLEAEREYEPVRSGCGRPRAMPALAFIVPDSVLQLPEPLFDQTDSGLRP